MVTLKEGATCPWPLALSTLSLWLCLPTPEKMFHLTHKTNYRRHLKRHLVFNIIFPVKKNQGDECHFFNVHLITARNTNKKLHTFRMILIYRFTIIEHYSC